MLNEEKTLEDVLVQEALDDLLSITGDVTKKRRDLEKAVKKPHAASKNTDGLKLYSSNGLAAVIMKAQNAKKEVNKQMWVSATAEAESKLEKKIKLKNKSEYDSDVLRERILRRQAEKRGFDDSGAFSLKGMVANYKGPKKGYGDN